MDAGNSAARERECVAGDSSYPLAECWTFSPISGPRSALPADICYRPQPTQPYDGTRGGDRRIAVGCAFRCSAPSLDANAQALDCSRASIIFLRVR